MPDALDLIHASSPAQLLTDEVLRRTCDLAPGGAALFDTVGADRLRAELQDAGLLGPDIRGHDAVIPYLGSGDIRYGVIERANTLLVDIDTALAVVGSALAASIDQDERAQHVAFQRDLGASSLPLPLYLPRRPQVVEALRAMADTPAGKAVATTLEMLTAALDAGRCKTPAERELRDVVWSELLAASELPALDLDARTNRERMEAMFGSFPHQHTLRLYPQLRRTVAGAIGYGRPTGTSTARADVDGEVMTVADCMQLVADYVDAHGYMPRHSDLTPATLAAVEAALGTTFTTWCEQLAAIHGIRSTRRSDNERFLDAIVGQLYHDRIVSSQEEWTCPETFDAAYRIDTHVVVSGERRTELFCEADGEGHFAQVSNWDLKRTRTNDRRKAAALRDRIHDLREVGEDGLLLAVHHGLLSGGQAMRLDAGKLAAVIDAASAEQAWWVYVRPAGSRDMRSCPSRGAPRRLRDTSIDDTIEVFVLTW